MNFRVGQKVVCIWRVEAGSRGVHRTHVGRIYTIRGFDDVSAQFHGCPPGLYFEELVNKKILTTVGLHESSYTAIRFRPVVERKTDISIFKKLLVPGSKIPEHA